MLKSSEGYKDPKTPEGKESLISQSPLLSNLAPLLRTSSAGFFLLFLGVLLTLFSFAAPVSSGPEGKAPVWGYKIIRTFPHDPKAYTQGLVFYQGSLYEGTGLQGKSSLRKIELETGSSITLASLPDSYFGEGITIFAGKLIQLTWQNRTGFVYGLRPFKLLNKFYYNTEGWGITQNGHRLIMSDGTDILYFLDPQSFQEENRIRVKDRDKPVSLLNELEFIKGAIYANVYLSDRIVRIDPENGRVTGWINLSGLLSAKEHLAGAEVLNGIAYDSEKDRIFVTGKFWPKLFEIQFVPPGS